MRCFAMRWGVALPPLRHVSNCTGASFSNARTAVCAFENDAPVEFDACRGGGKTSPQRSAKYRIALLETINHA